MGHYKASFKIIISSLVFFILLIFTFIQLDKVFSFVQISKALSATGALFIGASFSMSWLCYYFDFVDDKIHYRKHLGLVGYFYILAYCLSLLIVDPERYLFGFKENFWTADFILGLVSMTMFTFMALISHKKAIVILGAKRWRKAFRVGFLAWFLLVVRAYILEKEIWLEWLATFDGFIPPRLFLSFFVIFILSMRLSIEFSKMIKKQQISS